MPASLALPPGPWAIDAAYAEHFAAGVAAGRITVETEPPDYPPRLVEVLPHSALPARSGSPPPPPVTIGVLPIVGVIAQRVGDWYGDTWTDRLAERFDELWASDKVDAIVLDVDSPGGIVFGTPELAAKIFGARGRKPIAAVANSFMASAAYWIGSAADEVIIAPSGEGGSIGVLSMHVDVSKALDEAGYKVTFVTAGRYKVEGNPYEPLGQEARDQMQRGVDYYYDLFVGAVARHRGVSPKQVRSDFGEGRLFTAKPAVEAGLVDRIGTLPDVLQTLAAKVGKRKEAQRQAAERAARLRNAQIS